MKVRLVARLRQPKEEETLNAKIIETLHVYRKRASRSPFSFCDGLEPQHAAAFVARRSAESHVCPLLFLTPFFWAVKRETGRAAMPVEAQPATSTVSDRPNEIKSKVENWVGKKQKKGGFARREGITAKLECNFARLRKLAPFFSLTSPCSFFSTTVHLSCCGCTYYNHCLLHREPYK